MVVAPVFCGMPFEFTARGFADESDFTDDAASAIETAPGFGFEGFCALTVLSITAATGISLLFSCFFSSSSSSLSSGDSSELAYFLFGSAFG